MMDVTTVGQVHQFAEVRTSDLIDASLDWALADAEGLNPYLVAPHYGNPWRVFIPQQGEALQWGKRFNAGENLEVFSQLLDRHTAMVRNYPNAVDTSKGSARVVNEDGVHWETGPTPAIALYRAIVRAKFGDFARVPAQLLPA